ncbi:MULTISPECIES: M24 family metallopeptidase [Rhizobium/Agrobacterium group]|uniref:Proline dipeptidase n=2 Tax=Rhizobium/Agrobacterium group TaxID=227290 RepID=B9K0U4_ALLAM|nr:MULTISPECIES: Xaa-Pro peptidase family protein [Rhizobium/Agrobacterium group]ACM38492.1 proline dipeptidase [Allorhizobium ampelinum S4]MCF1445658.1 aminopeptidase P family protein [Allorhizobium ampelinum]MCF1491350.1 aminopeptidase P family protein [Allorhizobium ampelinum]MUO26810.1 M24 family metallopeptidase [Agrobacterium vitis]MUO40228.1 M24 family metallopeptidase [Agrobacterium vitis]
MSSLLSAPKISMEERVIRLETLRKTMAEKDIGAVLIGSTESLRYFTGLAWHGSERLVGAVITASDLVYVVPGFERSRVETLPHLPGDIRVWEEDESSAALVASFLPHASTLAVDDFVPLFVYNALKREIVADRLIDGGPLLRGQRLRKSAAEIAIIQYAMNLTLDVQRKAHAMIRPGIAASEVVRFIDDEHRRLGASNGSTFCIVSFGETTSLPHGADDEQYYQPGDVVLVDTGCRIDGYNSDITRTYMLEEPTAEFARIWDIERAAQQAVFDAARIGATCGSLDDAARDVLTRHGLGPDYQLPGLPHRAGHGLGLEGHEEPYIVRGNTVRLDAGMCFSCEPMIVLPGQFGLRLEDIIYMTSDGPNWFTQPAKGPTEPFSG